MAVSEKKPLGTTHLPWKKQTFSGLKDRHHCSMLGLGLIKMLMESVLIMAPPQSVGLACKLVYHVLKLPHHLRSNYWLDITNNDCIYRIRIVHVEIDFFLLFNK